MARTSSSSDRSNSSASTRLAGAVGLQEDLEKSLDDIPRMSGQDDSQRRQRTADVESITPEEEDHHQLSEEHETAEKSAATGLSGVLSRIVSRASTVDPGPPPDGGMKAWMIGKGIPLTRLLAP
jgi:hypothetical protein